MGTEASSTTANLLGGIFGGAARTAESLPQMAARPQHDSALKQAVEEIRPLCKQCTRCGQWVCQPVCWNKKAGLCETTFCPECGTPISAKRKCASCGAEAEGSPKFCPECGAPFGGS